MNSFINDSVSLVEQLNDVLRSRSDCVINIINDKLTLSVFELLKENLSKVREVNFIIRDPRTLPDDEAIYREFELDLNPSETFFSQYDIVEKNRLRHFSQARAMSAFIEKHVNVRRTRPYSRVGGNVLIVDDAFLICGTSSLELAPKVRKNGGGGRSDIHFDTLLTESMDSDQIRGAHATFDRIWNSDELTLPFKTELLKSLEYVYKEHSPEFLYYFTLNELFGHHLDPGVERFEKDTIHFKQTNIWNALYDFQKEAVLSAITKLNKYNGCIIADSVGLGKTFEALAVIKYFELRNDNVLVLTPAKLHDNWLSFLGAYKDGVLDEDFHYKIMFHTDLSRTRGMSRSGWDLSRFDWGKFDLVVIDESHNFRNREERADGFTRYQRLLREVVCSGVSTKLLLLSATPVNNSLVDLKNQLSIMTADRDDAYVEYGIESIAQTLKNATQTIHRWDMDEEKEKSELLDRLDANFYRLLEMVSISRSRKHITQYYPSDKLGTFPVKLKPITLVSDIDSQNELLKFQETNDVLESLKLAIYTPMAYIRAEFREFYREKFQTNYKGQAIFFQENREMVVRTLQRFNLFKRLESSVFSFGETIRRLLERIDDCIRKLENKMESDLSFVQTMEDAAEEESLDYKLDIRVAHLNIPFFLEDLNYDRAILTNLLNSAERIQTEHRDNKLAELKQFVKTKLDTTPYNDGNRKILIFSAFADTAEYLYDAFRKETYDEPATFAVVTGSRPPHASNWKLEQCFNNILSAFSPQSRLNRPAPDEDQVTVLIGTDCISEGQNLQDCDCVINYDIHWNPVTLIQRFGRIDRIGSRNARIQMINFFPNLELNEYLNLEARIKNKMISVNLASTGDENLLSPEMNDLNFRGRQLKKLREEVIELEETNENISLTDLNMHEYLFELSGYLKSHPELKKVPLGIYAITSTHSAKLDGTSRKINSENASGVLFCFKHRRTDCKPNSDSSLYPYYLIYMNKDGSVICGNRRVRDLLRDFRGFCLNRKTPDPVLVDRFLKETDQTNEMKIYSDLLNKAIQSIQGSEEVSTEQSVFDFGGFNNLFANKTSDDFELVSFLVTPDSPL